MEAVAKKYICPACGKTNLKRKVIGIWSCKSCKATFTGGAYVPATQLHVDVTQSITRQKVSE